MRDHRPTSTSDLLAQSRLKTIQEHAEQVQHLTKKLKEMLPRGTENFVRVANVRSNHLHLQVASAAIKMKLSYERLTILNFLRGNGYPALMGIEITIDPNIYIVKEPKSNSDSTRENPPVSENAAAMLKMISQNASPKVRARLENIAKLAELKNQKTGD
ncbi:DUF721 domain-containing protein [Vibrio viridaestus]|uniref:DUF721 domain-containing protein n=1 Tax=Vibrio viridaestus TaxID=2487322 RepID=A0A3N9THJ1_9VIBR|nr:DUF721 domain-containing protein [Vibrio viridaestus]